MKFKYFHFYFFTSLILFIGTVIISSVQSNGVIGEYKIGESSVENILLELGGEKPTHYLPSYDSIKAHEGEELILFGKTKHEGSMSKRISGFFVCTDCHNIEREVDVVSDNDPEHRLAYAVKHGLPFLQGSTFWGMYNRKSWYNGDYIKKYGDLVINSRDTLANAIQLCAKYCSSGRSLDQWELEAIMHYYKKNELRINELNLSDEITAKLSRINTLDAEDKKNIKEKVENSFIRAYPATFLETMPRDNRKYGEGADADKGKQLFDKSCMYCHENGRVTYLKLDNDRLTGRFFWKHITDYTDRTLYQIIRYGTNPKAGRKQYMPHYTKEKMSDKQIEDLVAYIRILANK
jgi:mono/diheme cytochrome c family protein